MTSRTRRAIVWARKEESVSSGIPAVKPQSKIKVVLLAGETDLGLYR